jgi:hypothetical protein
MSPTKKASTYQIKSFEISSNEDNSRKGSPRLGDNSYRTQNVIRDKRGGVTVPATEAFDIKKSLMVKKKLDQTMYKRNSSI